MSVYSELFRRDAAKNDRIRDAGLSTPSDVIRYDDICYGSDEKWQVLDVYKPKDSCGKLPVIFDVHGGGWVYGDKELYQFYCMDLARRGFAVVNYTYRLAPEFKFPSSLEDTNLAAQFVVNNADTYGFDLNNIFGVGDSAGAHLLGLYTDILINEDYAGRFDFKVPEGFMFRGLALNCGCYDVKADGREDRLYLIGDLMPDGGTEEEMDLLNVLLHMNDKFPPTYVMSATGDFLKEQLGMIQAELLKYDIPYMSRYYTSENSVPIRRGQLRITEKPYFDDIPEMPSGERALGHVFHLNIRVPEAIKCNDQECDFFKKLYKRE